MSKKRYDSKEKEGVNAIEKIILDWNWIFRPQERDDKGIDAHIEICENGNPTGQLIAVQIKSGKSYLKGKNNTTKNFYFGKTHYKYWINHSLPVLVVFYNPDTKITQWQHVNISTVSKTKQKYKLQVPESNIFDDKAKEIFNNIAELKYSNPKDAIYKAFDKIDSLSPNWGLDIRKQGQNIFSSIRAKHPDAHLVEPLKTTFKFKPDTVFDGKNISEIINDPKLNGNPLHIKPEQLDSVEYSEFLKQAFDFNNISTIGYSIIPINEKMVDLSFKSFEFKDYEINGIDLKYKDLNDGDYELSNNHQDIPYKIRIVRTTKKELHFTFTIEPKGHDIKKILYGYKFLDALALGGQLTIRQTFFKKIISQNILEKNININSDKPLMELLEMLVEIQEKFDLQLIYPEKISNIELEKIKWLNSILKGSCVQFIGSSLTIRDIYRDNAIEIYDNIKKNGYSELYKIQNDTQLLLGNKLDLGKIHIYSNSVTLDQKNQDKLKIFIKSDSKDPIELEISPYQDTYILTIYENYFIPEVDLNIIEMQKIANEFKKISELNK